MNYAEFLAAKKIADRPSGFECDESLIPSKAFEFQRDVIKWQTKRGRSAVFFDCGLGKTITQLSFGQQIVEETNKPFLLLAPNEVVKQTIKEGSKFGIEATHVKGDGDVVTGINITNYEKLHKFNALQFSGLLILGAFCA